MKIQTGKTIGCGCINKGTRRCRRAYRECRKNFKRYGVSFDDSETWNIDYAFVKYCLKHNIIDKNNKFVKSYFNWGVKDEFDYIIDKYGEFKNEYIEMEWNVIFNDIHIYENKQELTNWLIPRIERYITLSDGYPSDMNSRDEWLNYCHITIDELKDGCLERFINKIGSFWW